MKINNNLTSIVGKGVVLLVLLTTGLFAINNNKESKAINACYFKLGKKYDYLSFIKVTLENDIYKTKWKTKDHYIYCNVSKDKIIDISKEKRNDK